MKRLLACLPFILVSNLALGQDWQGTVRQDIHVAYGGSDANGILRFECADPASGFASAGQLIVSLRTMDGVTLSKKRIPGEFTFWVSDGLSFVLPMALKAGSDRDLRYIYDPATAQTVRDMLAAVRTENRATAFAGDQRLIAVTLEGSAVALKEVVACAQ